MTVRHTHNPRGIGANVDFHKTSSTVTTDYLNVNKTVVGTVDIWGNIAHAQADAKADGLNSIAQVTTSTNAVDYHGSAAHADSLSATNGFHFLYDSIA